MNSNTEYRAGYADGFAGREHYYGGVGSPLSNTWYDMGYEDAVHCNTENENDVSADRVRT